MTQRPRLSPESSSTEVRAARLEGARQITRRSPEEDDRAHFERRFFEATEVLNRFRDALDEMPQRAFERSYGAFSAAAEYSTAAHLLNLFNDGHPMKRVIAALEFEVGGLNCTAEREPGSVQAIAEHCNRDAVNRGCGRRSRSRGSTPMARRPCAGRLRRLPRRSGSGSISNFDPRGSG